MTLQAGGWTSRGQAAFWHAKVLYDRVLLSCIGYPLEIL